ncbi:MAG: DUF4932 domain-containing protein [Gemmatimonadaceae bacterium]
MELLGIAYRLARNAFPQDSLNAEYVAAIQRHFAGVREHSFVRTLARLADSASQAQGDLGGWEIPSLALHLGPAPAFEPLVDGTDTGDGWDDRSLLRPPLLQLLRDFYKDANAEAFFQAERPYYSTVNDAYRQPSTTIDQSWIERFAGLAATETYTPVVSLMALGLGDYIRVNFGKDRRNSHTIVGSVAYNVRGVLASPDAEFVARSSLHEAIHAYTNQIVDRHASELRGAAERLLSDPRVRERVRGTFYDNWRFLLYESLVRAVTIQYHAAMGGAANKDREIAVQEGAGFLWMGGLVRALDRYARERARYPDLSAFAPELVRFFDREAGR